MDACPAPSTPHLDLLGDKLALALDLLQDGRQLLVLDLLLEDVLAVPRHLTLQGELLLLLVPQRRLDGKEGLIAPVDRQGGQSSEGLQGPKRA